MISSESCHLQGLQEQDDQQQKSPSTVGSSISFRSSDQNPTEAELTGAVPAHRHICFGGPASQSDMSCLWAKLRFTGITKLARV